MTIGELRRFLGTLPLDSDGWPVLGLDIDTADVFEVQKASAGSWAGGPALVLGVEIEG